MSFGALQKHLRGSRIGSLPLLVRFSFRLQARTSLTLKIGLGGVYSLAKIFTWHWPRSLSIGAPRDHVLLPSREDFCYYMPPNMPLMSTNRAIKKVSLVR